ncbi:hypothetical protein GCM10029963_29560 [Micromonospora andamanensis]
MSTDGLIVVDKPGGMTSHDVVARIRRLARTRRVGHGGTLDPMATGVLVIGVGRATRLLTYVIGADKSYTATIRLGQATVTDDAEGDVIATTPAGTLTDEAVREVLAGLTGEIDQVPSAVSAIKINGQRAYKRVREGRASTCRPGGSPCPGSTCWRSDGTNPTWSTSTWTWPARPARTSGRSPATRAWPWRSAAT